MAMPLRSALKQSAKDQMKVNFGNSIIVVLLYSIMIGVLSSLYGISLILGGPIQLGLTAYFVNLKRNKDPKIENLFGGFNNFVNSLVAYLLVVIFTVLWSLLFIIPGIVKAISYSQTFYILNDNPEMSGNDARKESMKMMEGHKGEFFVLLLSFLGWFILCGLTFGILYIVYVGPYMNTTLANYYDALKGDKAAAPTANKGTAS